MRGGIWVRHDDDVMTTCSFESSSRAQDTKNSIKLIKTSKTRRVCVGGMWKELIVVRGSGVQSQLLVALRHKLADAHVSTAG